MNIDLINEIMQNDFDINKFSKMAITNESFRNDVVAEMIHNPNIMAYYHCYYITKQACEEKPCLFYSYWDNFADLLNHQNSYHRDFGIELIARLIPVDKEKRFDLLINNYLRRLYDDKFSTAQYCVRNLAPIVNTRSDLSQRIVTELTSEKLQRHFPEKQSALLGFDILNVIDTAYHLCPNKNTLQSFIKKCTDSLSPKTRKRARELIGEISIKDTLNKHF